MSELSLDLIRRDGGTQPRANLNQDLIQEYAEAMQRDDQFDPVIVYHDGKDYWLADGFHRVGAALLNKSTVIDADIRQGTRRDAILYSVGANETHGLRRSNEDKERAIKTVLADEEWRKWSDSEIARRCKVNHTTVKKYRDELYPAKSQDSTRTVTRGGTTFTMSTAKIGASRPKPEPPKLNVLSLGDLVKVNHAYGVITACRPDDDESERGSDGYFNLRAAFIARTSTGIERRSILGQEIELIEAGGFKWGSFNDLDIHKYLSAAIQRLLTPPTPEPVMPTETAGEKSAVPTSDPNPDGLPSNAEIGPEIPPSNSADRESEESLTETHPNFAAYSHFICPSCHETHAQFTALPGGFVKCNKCGVATKEDALEPYTVEDMKAEDRLAKHRNGKSKPVDDTCEAAQKDAERILGIEGDDSDLYEPTSAPITLPISDAAFQTIYTALQVVPNLFFSAITEDGFHATEIVGGVEIIVRKRQPHAKQGFATPFAALATLVETPIQEGMPKQSLGLNQEVQNRV